MSDELRHYIRKYVEANGSDAFAFSTLHYPRFGDVPGEKIQRMIDEEIKRKGRR